MKYSPADSAPLIDVIPILFQEYNYKPEPGDEGMGIGDEERREKMNRGKFAHEFTQIYTNWRLVRTVSPFKTGACLLMGRNFRIVADNITAYLYWKWNKRPVLFFQ